MWSTARWGDPAGTCRLRSESDRGPRQDLRPVRDRAQELAEGFERFEMLHIQRVENRDADGYWSNRSQTEGDRLHHRRHLRISRGGRHPCCRVVTVSNQSYAAGGQCESSPGHTRISKQTKTVVYGKRFSYPDLCEW